MANLPEDTRSLVAALAFVSYAVGLLVAMGEDPWFAAYSHGLDLAYQTTCGILLRDFAEYVPGLEEAVRSMTASLSDSTKPGWQTTTCNGSKARLSPSPHA